MAGITDTYLEQLKLNNKENKSKTHDDWFQGRNEIHKIY